MYALEEKSKDNKSRVVTNNIVQKRGDKQQVYFKDNRVKSIVPNNSNALRTIKSDNTIKQLRSVNANNGTMQMCGIGIGVGIGGLAALAGIPLVHDLYQRYRRYIQPADRSAEHLLGGGIHGQTENAGLNVEQQLDTLRQAYDIRNARQDDTRAHLSPPGRFISGTLREGHSNLDSIITNNISREFPGRDAISDEELEFALQKSIMGATRTRGSFTRAARVVGAGADLVGL